MFFPIGIAHRKGAKVETGLYIGKVYVTAPSPDKVDGTEVSPLSSSLPSPSQTISDKIDISEFSVTSPVEDFLPQSRSKIDTQKHFKSLKEYIAYMLMLYDKIDKIKPMEGRQYVKLEDQTELQKLEKEFNDLTTGWTV